MGRRAYPGRLPRLRDRLAAPVVARPLVEEGRTMTAPETPPADIPPYDFAVIRSVGALRVWEDHVWRWDGKTWQLVKGRTNRTPDHGMVPGSHERPGGAECRCGEPWSRWDDACRAQLLAAGACPHEGGCLYLRKPDAADCGNHERSE
jgi:hypothetical protein